MECPSAHPGGLLIFRPRPFAPGLAWSLAVGRVAGLPLPRPVLRRFIKGYSKFYGVQMADVAVPRGGYSTFGEFFTRDLNPEARPVDETEGALAVPCDGVVTAVGALGQGTRGDLSFRVKGSDYTAVDLIGRTGWWSDATSGGYAVVYLSPGDYHRVHSPVEGELRDVWRLPGMCLPVNKLGQRLAPWAIVRNERVVFDLVAAQGRLTLVMVGALAVRAIDVSLDGFDRNAGNSGLPLPVGRAQEIGVFNLGSTVVALWQWGTRMDIQTGERVFMGQRMALP